jgi:hypothetical protein
VSKRPPFIQVGTVEDIGRAGRVYAAFWTDTTRGFRPQILFHVRPGDAVSAALRLMGGAWHVSIVDATLQHRSTLSTHEEVGGDFNFAEWLQENPTEISGKATPYPDLTPLHMTALTVNGTTPRYGDMFAQWMSLPGRYLAPTPLRGRAFTIRRSVLSAAGRRYLEIARPQNMSARKFDTEAARWTERTPASEIARVSGEAAASERRYADGLDRQTWPAAARAPIGSLIRAVRLEAGMFAALSRHAPPRLGEWRSRFTQITPSLLGLAHAVRRALRVPELVSGPLTSSAPRRTG